MSGGSNDALDGIRVDDLSDIRVSENGSVKSVSSLFFSSLSEGSEDFVEGSEGGLGPDDESSEMTSWGELLKLSL